MAAQERWRSPHAVTEDRNSYAGIGVAPYSIRLRSPHAVTEDRNTTDCVVYDETTILVAFAGCGERGSQR